MPKKKHSVGQRASLHRIKKLKISEEEKAEVAKIAEFIFKLVNEKR